MSTPETPDKDPDNAAHKASGYGKSCTECRRRKVKCRQSPDDATRCVSCIARNTECVEQKRAIPVRKAPRRKELVDRIAQLENMMRGHSESDEDEHDDKSASLSPRRRQPANSVEDFLNASSRERSVSPAQESLFSSGMGEIISLNDLNRPVINTTLHPIGGFKHEKDCKMLLTALNRVPNLQIALQKHSHFWALRMKMTEPNSTHAERDIIQYARKALAGDNPIKIGKVMQAVACVTGDEKLILAVDRIIISDDEYLSTIDGMECTMEQGKMLTEFGQVRRSWLHTRKVMGLVAQIKMHQSRRTMREERLWDVIFPTDRFFSLLMRADYSIPDSAIPESALSDFPRHRLAILVGKVIDQIGKHMSVAYSSVLEVDEELKQFLEYLTKQPQKPDPLPHHPPGSPFRGPPHGEEAFTMVVFYRAMLELHLPWMLQSLTNSSLEYSRVRCFEAARATAQQFIKSRLLPGLFPQMRCVPLDFDAFVALATLCVGRFGYAPDHGDNLDKDVNLVNGAIDIFRQTKNNISQQCVKNLKQLLKLHKKWNDGEEVPKSIQIPFLGQVVIPEKPTLFEHFPTDMPGFGIPPPRNFETSQHHQSQHPPVIPQFLQTLQEAHPGLFMPAGPTPYTMADAAAYTIPDSAYTVPFDVASFPFLPQTHMFDAYSHPTIRNFEDQISSLPHDEYGNQPFHPSMLTSQPPGSMS